MSDSVLEVYKAFSLGPCHPSKLYSSSIMQLATPDPPSEEDCKRLLHPSLQENDGLSAPQRDAVVMARLKNEDGESVIVADSTGCGKGREGVAITANNLKLDKSKLALYFSSANLCYDLTRDVKDLGLKLSVYDARKLVGRLPKSGILFVPYTFAVGRGDKSNFLDKLLRDLGHDVSIVLDESHTVKNCDGTNPSKTGKAIKDFLSKMRERRARITFMSATFCTTLSDLALYSEHTGLSGPNTHFETFQELRNKLPSKAEAGALEFISATLVSRRSLISRTLGFDGVVFDNVTAAFDEEHTEMQRAASELWSDIITDPYFLDLEPRRLLFGAQQRFSRALILSAKVETCLEVARKALGENKQVVISILSTGEAALKRAAAAAEEDESVSSCGPRDTIISCLQNLRKYALKQIETSKTDNEAAEQAIERVDAFIPAAGERASGLVREVGWHPMRHRRRAGRPIALQLRRPRGGGSVHRLCALGG